MGTLDTAVTNERFTVSEYVNPQYHYNSTEDPMIKFEEIRSTYENEDFHIKWHIDGIRLNFVLTNKTEDFIRVKWQDAVFVNIDNHVRRVYHEGMMYADKSAFIPDMIVPSGAVYKDFILPINKAYANSSGGYSEAPILFIQSTSRKEFDKMVSECKGKELSVVLPIETNGSVKYYTFIFYVDDIQ